MLEFTNSTEHLALSAKGIGENLGATQLGYAAVGLGARSSAKALAVGDQVGNGDAGAELAASFGSPNGSANVLLKLCIELH